MCISQSIINYYQENDSSCLYKDMTEFSVYFVFYLTKKVNVWEIKLDLYKVLIQI